MWIWSQHYLAILVRFATVGFDSQCLTKPPIGSLVRISLTSSDHEGEYRRIVPVGPIQISTSERLTSVPNTLRG